MDIASLIAKRELFRLWIVTPLAAILVLGASSGAFKNYKVNTLAEQEALYHAIPQLEQSVNQATTILNTFKGKTTSGIETGDEIIALLNQVASKEKFKLVSAGVEKKPLDKSPGVHLLKATVQGSGNLVSIIKFMDGVLNEQPLLTENNVELRQISGQTGQYSVTFIFNRLFTD